MAPTRSLTARGYFSTAQKYPAPLARTTLQTRTHPLNMSTWRAVRNEIPELEDNSEVRLRAPHSFGILIIFVMSNALRGADQRRRRSLAAGAVDVGLETPAGPERACCVQGKVQVQDPEGLAAHLVRRPLRLRLLAQSGTTDGWLDPTPRPLRVHRYTFDDPTGGDRAWSSNFCLRPECLAANNTNAGTHMLGNKARGKMLRGSPDAPVDMPGFDSLAPDHKLCALTLFGCDVDNEEHMAVS